MGAAQNQGTVVDLDLQHPYLRNCKTRTTANGTDILATVPAQLPTYKKWKEQLETLTASLTMQSHLLLAKGHHFDEGGVCSTSGELQLEYEYYPRLLSSEIGLRKKENRRFTQGELWYLLYVLVMGKDALAQNGETIGDIHPRNIFLNNTGQVKIACLRSWPGQVSNYRRAVLEEESGYLAPEDFQRLRLGAMDNQINTEAEIFSIGLVLLSTASLQLQHELYNMKDRQFQEETFYSRLGKFQHDALYSEIFRAVISNLLEIDSSKRMNLHELKAFLQRHTENITAKKPLRIDNVGKKLQSTITIMMKSIHQPPANERPVAQIVNNNAANISPVKPAGVRASGERIINYINFQERRPSQDIIPPPPKNESNIEINQQRNSILNPPFQPPPPPPQNYHKPPIPVSYLVTMINSSNQQPHRPIINKAFSATTVGPVITKTQSSKIESPPKYKPFQTITTKGQVQQTLPNKESQIKVLRQQPSIQAEIKNNIVLKAHQQPKEGGQKPTITEIWLGQETSIGQLNLLMDTKSNGFGCNSLINPKYEPEVVDQPFQSFQPSHQSRHNEQERVEEVKQESQQSPQEQSQHHHSQLSKQVSYPPDSLVKQPEPQEKQVFTGNYESSNVEEQQLLLNNSAKPSQIKQIDKKLESMQAQHAGNQKLRQSESEQSQVSKKSNKIQVVELQVSNQTKPFSPLVKVWGMNMGFNRTSRAKVEANQTQTVANIREAQINSQKICQIPSPTAKPNNHDENLRQERCLLDSQIRKTSEILNLQETNKQEYKPLKQQQIVDQEYKHDSRQFTKEANQEISKFQSHSDNYILIQEESKYTHNEHEKSSQINIRRISKQQIKEKQSQIIQYHTYADVSTNGTFEQCWQQILVFLRDPTDYTAKIDPCKVKIRILDDRWSLKVGPGVFDILLNKEQGKFLLKNCEGSRCEGEMLGGIYKDQEKKHRIWFNSAYYYKGIKIPSKEIIDECLKKCKENIDS